MYDIDTPLPYRSVKGANMWNQFLKLMKFGPYSNVANQSDPRPIPLSAISGWAVAHGAGHECLHEVTTPDNEPPKKEVN